MTLPVSIFSPAQLAYLLGIAAVLGACLGSFINCLAWRMVNGESALRGRSHCATCNHVLGPLDLIPIVSWIALRGRCRYCGERVSPRYMLVEVFMALLFVALFVRYGFGVQALAYAALACILLGLSLVDLDTFIIPNKFIVAGFAVWAASVYFMPIPQPQSVSIGSIFAGFVGYTHLAVILDGVAGFVVMGAFVLLVSFVVDAVVGRQSLGGGDVKLLAMLGLFLGVAGSFVSLFFACIFGLVFAFIQQVSSSKKQSDAQSAPESSRSNIDLSSKDARDSEFRGKVRDASSPELRENVRDARSPEPCKNNESSHDSLASDTFRMKTIPFGPSIALAACATLLFGWQILTWYVGLL